MNLKPSGKTKTQKPKKNIQNIKHQKHTTKNENHKQNIQK